MQRAIVPVTAEERLLSRSLPSGVPLPCFSAATTPRTGNILSARLCDAAQGSLLAAIGTLAIPKVQESQPLSGVCEDVLSSTLRSALRGLHQCSPLRLRAKKVLSNQSRDTLVSTATCCIRVFASFSLQVRSSSLCPACCLPGSHAGRALVTGCDAAVRRAAESDGAGVKSRPRFWWRKPGNVGTAPPRLLQPGTSSSS